MGEHKKVKLEINGFLCDIDIDCVDWVLLFNKLGMTTKYCCHGDNLATSSFETVFHENVTDEQIHEFLRNNNKIWGFYKWTRTSGIDSRLLHNWVFSPRTKEIARNLYLKTIKERENV